jgi:hypothetical protein
MAEEAAKRVPRVGRKNIDGGRYGRTSNQRVVEFVAGAVVKNLMGVESAVRQLKPELTPFEQAQMAAKLENDPHVQRAVQNELKKRGLDEESKQRYIELIWEYAESKRPEDEKRQLTSLRLLGKAFLPEKSPIEKPISLPLRGLDEGLRRMVLGDDVVASMGVSPLPKSTDFEEDDEPAFDA